MVFPRPAFTPAFTPEERVRVVRGCFIKTERRVCYARLK